MRKFYAVIATFVLFLTQTSFAVAAGDNDSSFKQCDTVANACKSAGFTDEGTGDKSFWFGCMKPVLYGTTVNGVSIDKKDVEVCRKAKIEKMKKEVKELEAVKG